MLTHRGVVYPWQCDHVGHMNVMWYVSKFDEATWQLFSDLGITSSYLRENQRGMAALEQNIKYKRELRAGDTLSIYSGILEIKEKTIRFYHEMRLDETKEIAATTVLFGVHMDTIERKARPFPDEIVKRGHESLINVNP
jgi:acyl-CoA thioester hydrolase